ncbi:hypothetical protein C2845_PM03G08990 [Panicum miliaceum]|uniref:DUF3615 domain-containing protein n=1 Tax=Panicum miliaceum TaxID=4540 RepID=A0A3L6T5Z7_PANMI|nr:hypothetical protein C2845_PM03G08990 [Panicum miliaceum]
MIGGAKPLAAPLLGATPPAGRRLAPASCAPDPSPALATAAAQSPGQSDRAPPPRPPDEPAASPTALRSTSQLSRWSRARALRSGRRLGLDRAAVSSAPAVTRPPPTPTPTPPLVPVGAAAAEDDDDDLCVAERDAVAGKAIYMVSDGTGWTAEHSVNAALGQFEHCLVDSQCAVSTHLFSGIDDMDRLLEDKIFGLTINPVILQAIRKTRAKTLGFDGYTSNYAEMAHVRQELDHANQLFAQNPMWPVIGVTGKAIEETAAVVVRVHHDRKQKCSMPRISKRCQEDEEHEVKPASAQTVQKATLSAFQSKPVAPPWQPSGRCLTLSLGSRVWERLRRDWGRTFCIRLDLQGCFHTYPDVGRPFQNLQEADEAINLYLEGCRDPKMCVEEEGAGFSIERAVRQSLYWPDGTIRKRTKSYIAKKSHNRRFLIAQALVDKYNEDYNLLKDDAHKLKDVLNCPSIYENRSLYYHLNFTTSEGASPNICSMDNLIFAEVKRQHCYGCTNRGHADMKHPDSSVEYMVTWMWACHVTALQSGVTLGDGVKYVKRKEAVLRRQYEGLDQERVIKRLMTLPPGVTIVDD